MDRPVDPDRAAVGVVARATRTAAVALPFAFLAVFFVYPVATIVGRGLVVDGHVDAGPVLDVVRDAGLRHVLWFTVEQAALSTLLTLAVGLPVAWVLARVAVPGRTFLWAAFTVPFVLPTVVVGVAFRSLLAPGGPLDGLGLDQSLGAILLAHVFFNVAVVVRAVGTVWERLDTRQEDAARVLGATRARAWYEVTWPALRPAVLAAAALVFLFSFTAFGTILVLGGPRFATIETEIYRSTAQLLDLRAAAGLAVVQFLFVVALLLVVGWLQRGAPALDLRARAASARPPRSARERVGVVAALTPAALVVGLPLAVLVARAFDTPGGVGVANFRALGTLPERSALFVPPTEALRNSVLFALVATVLAVGLGTVAALAVTGSRRAIWELLLTLPLGVSAVTVGFGFLVALDEGILDLRGSWMLVPISHALVAMPFVVRLLTPTLRGIDPRLREAAAVLGATPTRVRREVDLPIVARAATVAAGFAAAISLGEFGATAFIARPDRPTLPVVIFRLVGQPGTTNFGAAMAASVVLMVLAAAIVVAVECLRDPVATEP